MTKKVFDQIAEGLQEALAVSEENRKVRDAIEVIKAHLDKEWISDGCETEHAFGCASCQAVGLKAQLDSLAAILGE